MDKLSVIGKIGTILSDLQKQQEFFAKNHDSLNEVEVELFAASANYLAEYAKVLKKFPVSRLGTPLVPPRAAAQAVHQEDDDDIGFRLSFEEDDKKIHRPGAADAQKLKIKEEPLAEELAEAAEEMDRKKETGRQEGAAAPVNSGQAESDVSREAIAEAFLDPEPSSAEPEEPATPSAKDQSAVQESRAARETSAPVSTRSAPESSASAGSPAAGQPEKSVEPAETSRAERSKERPGQPEQRPQQLEERGEQPEHRPGQREEFSGQPERPGQPEQTEPTQPGQTLFSRRQENESTLQPSFPSGPASDEQHPASGPDRPAGSWHDPAPSASEEEKQRRISLNERFGEKKSTLYERIAPKQHQEPSQSPIANLGRSIGINERYYFIKTLFQDDKVAFDQAITRIDMCHSLGEALEYTNKSLAGKYNWSRKEDDARKFYDLLKRRFV